MTRWWLVLGLLLVAPAAFADDVVVCDPTHALVPNAVTRVVRRVDSTPFIGLSGYLLWTAPHAGHTAQQVADFNMLRGQMDSLAVVPDTYWKCLDANANGVLDSVTVMSQAEQDAMDAPAVAFAALQASYDAEITGSDLCTATLDELTTRINAERDVIQTSIDATTNIASAKTAMTAMNTRYAAALRKAVKCIRARAR